eukprot:SAG31_NODE_954_length_10804_cov_3.240355_6_plen_112_part_00
MASAFVSIYSVCAMTRTPVKLIGCSAARSSNRPLGPTIPNRTNVPRLAMINYTAVERRNDFNFRARMSPFSPTSFVFDYVKCDEICDDTLRSAPCQAPAAWIAARKSRGVP